jgi:hypothetical protein
MAISTWQLAKTNPKTLNHKRHEAAQRTRSGDLVIARDRVIRTPLDDADSKADYTQLEHDST